MPRKTWTVIDHEQNLNLDQLRPRTRTRRRLGQRVLGHQANLAGGPFAGRRHRRGAKRRSAVHRPSHAWHEHLEGQPRQPAAWLEIARQRARPPGPSCTFRSPAASGSSTVSTNWSATVGWRATAPRNSTPTAPSATVCMAKIANLPAHRLDITIDGDSGEIIVSGTVDEARLFGAKLRLWFRRSPPGLVSRAFRSATRSPICRAEPCDMQLLYHINLGMPLARARLPGGCCP